MKRATNGHPKSSPRQRVETSDRTPAERRPADEGMHTPDQNSEHAASRAEIEPPADDRLYFTPYQMRRFRLRQLLPRFLGAVDSLATAPDSSLRGRLAWAAGNVLVIHPDDFPDDLRPRFEDFARIVRSGRVPDYAKNHPKYSRSQTAFYLSPAKARFAADLLLGLLESIAYNLGRNELPVPANGVHNAEPVHVAVECNRSPELPNPPLNPPGATPAG